MERKLKVYTAPTHDNNTPRICLQGKWLREAGFEIGTSLIVDVKGGEIRITRADEVIIELSD